LTIASFSRTSDTEYVLTLNRAIASSETVVLKYDGAAGTIQEVGGEQRNVASFTKRAAAPVQLVQADGYYYPFMAMLAIAFDKACDTTPPSYDGWSLTASTSGALSWASTPPSWSGSTVILRINPSKLPTAGETVTLSYNKAAAGANKVVANDGAELADCSIAVNWLMP
jgi:hypothetical protein